MSSGEESESVESSADLDGENTDDSSDKSEDQESSTDVKSSANEETDDGSDDGDSEASDAVMDDGNNAENGGANNVENDDADQAVAARRRHLAGLEVGRATNAERDDEAEVLTDDDIDNEDAGDLDDALEEAEEDDGMDDGAKPGRISSAAKEFIKTCMTTLHDSKNWLSNNGKTYKSIREGQLWCHPEQAGTAMESHLQLGGAGFCRLRLFVWCPRSMKDDCLKYVHTSL
jgi:hypothetical protein